MGVAKPTGEYAERMLDPGGWPGVDEQASYDRAQQYTLVLRQVTDVLETCRHQQAEIFDGGIWSGSGAGAANGQLRTLIGEMQTLQNGLATVITWHKHIAVTIAQAKSDVTDNVVSAHRTIDALEADPSLDAAELTEEIEKVVSMAHGANVGIVDGAAEWILASKAWKPPASALQDLLDQKTPPPVTIPEPPAVLPSPDPDPRPTPTQPVPVTPGTGGPTPPTGAPPVDGGGPQPTPGTPLTPGQPAVPTVPTPVGPSPVPGGAPGGGPGAPFAPATPTVPLSPAAGAPQPGAGGGGKGVTPAAASPGTLPASAKPAEESPAASPAGAPGVPAGAMGPGGSGGAGAGSGAKSRAPVGQKPADKSPSTRPAASIKSPGKSRPPPQAVPGEDVVEDEQGIVEVPAPVIPVSVARAERDAIAEAATADAARRAGPDPLQLARRIAAALNAPGVGGGMDLGFFWVTGVTSDGAIVVANSYGLAYIPDGVELPEKVHLASGDETIPAPDRARWATYPVVAVRGWADHHGKTLRAVIGTEEQLANSDAGVATVVLKPDDIPETGGMTGRSRLEVVDPESFERLAATTDARLVDLLPPAPARAEPPPDQQPAPTELVDPEAAAVLVSPAAEATGMGLLLAQMPATPMVDTPADDRFILWFEVMKPLASDAIGRQAAHLRAFQTYAACAVEAALGEAHTAEDPAAQRSAVAEWLYWKHLNELLNAALADPRISS